MSDQKNWEYRRLVFRLDASAAASGVSPDVDEVREIVDNLESVGPASWRLISDELGMRAMRTGRS